MLKTWLLLVLVLAYSSAGVHNGRIIGGETASRFSYYYQASLRTFVGSHFCGGTILQSFGTQRTKSVLTAAHCLENRNTTDVFVHAGTKRLDYSGYRYGTTKFLIHPEYDPITRANDIALVITTTYILPLIDVEFVDYTTLNTRDGINATFTGWGRTSDLETAPNDLQLLRVVVIKNEECKSRLAGQIEIRDSSLCTFAKVGEGACEGDDGGPLVANAEDKVIGVLSWTASCATGYPDVYTRVGSFASWLNLNKE